MAPVIKNAFNVRVIIDSCKTRRYLTSCALLTTVVWPHAAFKDTQSHTEEYVATNLCLWCWPCASVYKKMYLWYVRSEFLIMDFTLMAYKGDDGLIWSNFWKAKWLVKRYMLWKPTSMLFLTSKIVEIWSNVFDNILPSLIFTELRPVSIGWLIFVQELH